MSSRAQRLNSAMLADMVSGVLKFEERNEDGEFTPEQIRIAGDFIRDERNKVLADKSLTEEERKLRIKECRDKSMTLIAYAMKMRETAEEKYRMNELQAVAVADLRDWSEVSVGKLERTEHSKLHKIIEDSHAGRVFALTEEMANVVFDSEDHPQTFLVQHDWAAVFEHAENYLQEAGAGTDITLPYDECTFEFRIDGRSVVMLMQHVDKEKPVTATCITECTNGVWLVGGVDDSSFFSTGSDKIEGIHTAWKHARAVCIALEARVAEAHVIAPSPKLNKKRVAAGREPLKPHHLVDLAHKYRGKGKRGDGTSGRHVRLHFRRRHKRRYESGKEIWIEWMLVGDPDLGFVDKTYRI